MEQLSIVGMSSHIPTAILNYSVLKAALSVIVHA